MNKKNNEIVCIALQTQRLKSSKTLTDIGNKIEKVLLFVLDVLLLYIHKLTI